MEQEKKEKMEELIAPAVITPAVLPEEIPDSVTFEGMAAELVAAEEVEKEIEPMAAELAFASWIHGVNIQVEWPWLLEWIYRAGFGTRLKGKPGTTNWFHFAIPTPVIVDSKRYKVDSVMLRFTTGSVASIVRHIHVYDGERRIATHNNVNLTGSHGFERFTVPNKPRIYWGVGISIGVEFLNVPQSREMWFISAGADFYK